LAGCAGILAPFFTTFFFLPGLSAGFADETEK
jgi:hypothetical protein